MDVALCISATQRYKIKAHLTNEMCLNQFNIFKNHTYFYVFAPKHVLSSQA